MVDIIKKTRGEDWDYKWVNKPDYINFKLINKCDNIISNFRNLANKYGDDSLFFIKDDNCSLLFKVIMTNKKDIQGRKIISALGFSFKDSGYKLSNLANFLLNNNELDDDLEYIDLEYNDVDNSLLYFEKLCNDINNNETVYYGNYENINRLIDINKDNIVIKDRLYEIESVDISDIDLEEKKILSLEFGDEYTINIFKSTDGKLLYNFRKDLMESEIKDIDSEFN